MMRVLLYRLATGAYFSVIRIAALFNPKAKLFVEGRKGLVRRIQGAMDAEKRPRVWMHCASLGEFEQGRPLLEAMRRQYPQYAYVLTFFSPSGYEVRKNYPGADHIFYLPQDTPANARMLLDAIDPRLCLFIKYELWYFYLSEMVKRKMSVMLVSAIFRPDQGFFKWYGGLQRKMLTAFAHIFVQNEASKGLLAGIGISNVTVSGDTRFDRVIEAAADVQALDIADAFCQGSKVIVAGSTWKEDEEMLQKALPLLGSGWKLILVPHEVHESHIRDIEKLFEGQTKKWSDWNGDTSKQVLVVDKVGLLMQLYRYGTVAWIGGGFGKDGVHNVLEAAVYGRPCLFGPIYHQFAEAVELVEIGGAMVVKDAEGVAAALRTLDNEGKYEHTGSLAAKYVQLRGGATRIVMHHLASVIGTQPAN